MTQAQLAEACGWEGQSRVSNYETGEREPDLEDLLTIAKETGVNYAWLAVGGAMDMVTGLFDDSPVQVAPLDRRLRPIVEWTNADELDPNQHVVLPRLEVHLSAGNGNGPRDSEPAAYNAGQAYRADFVKRKGWSPKTHFSMYVKGASMEPTIPDGSVVVIDVSDKKIRSGSIYAVKIDDDLLLKRLHRLPGGTIRVESDNQARQYAPFEVNSESGKGFKVIGRAVNLTTDL